VGRAQPGRDSTIERERTIRRLEQDVVKLEAEERDLSGRVSALRQEVSTLEAAVESRQSELNAVQRRRSEVDGQLESRRSTLDMLNDRQRTVTEEAAQLREQVLADEESVRTARGRLESLLGDMAGLEDERSALESKRSELMVARDRARSHLAEARSSRHELELQAGSRRASLDSLRQSLERMDTQVSQLQARFVSLREEVARHAEPGDEHRVEMNTLLKQRVDAESRLAKARGTVQGLENEYREKEGERQAAIRRSDEIREALENARLKQQETELNARSLQQRIEQLGGDADELAKGLPEDAHPAEWEEQNEKLTQQIIRLEPVNLAAIDEYEEEGKRKDYLDKQNDDLCQALSTLENAIAKIDRKTRTRFKETFERVNKGVQELFPRLFGGGHGYLELTGEDLLTTGVAIMAQPPGKRISSLHLLSGGEKALTAVAFVFAIFRLNPAPFCLLDEVDAPLDEANVVRFCGLLKEMSETVEFILVTHNKITMEMVHQLSGVTMREPGVSRLVQVDVDEAAALAVN
jgi:chromosome segregation protein